MPAESGGEVQRSFPSVRGCLRGLDVLEAVGSLGSAHTREIVVATGLPRPTVIRFLETLLEGHYLVRGSEGAYALAPRVALLANGFNFDSWLVEITTPILLELLRKVGWPSDVMMLRGDTMVVRNSNRPHCVLDINRQYVGMHSPIAESASGRAYLAWCQEGERERLLALSAGVSSRKSILNEVQRTRERGYAIRDSRLHPELGAIAIPVFGNGRLQCILDCVYLPQAVTEHEIAERCMPAMREAAAAISAKFEACFGRRFRGPQRSTSRHS